MIRQTHTWRVTLDAAVAVTVCDYRNIPRAGVGLCIHAAEDAGLDLTVEFTAAQIPQVEELLAALVAKRAKTNQEVARG